MFVHQNSITQKLSVSESYSFYDLAGRKTPIFALQRKLGLLFELHSLRTLASSWYVSVQPVFAAPVLAILHRFILLSCFGGLCYSALAAAVALAVAVAVAVCWRQLLLFFCVGFCRHIPPFSSSDTCQPLLYNTTCPAILSILLLCLSILLLPRSLSSGLPFYSASAVHVCSCIRISLLGFVHSVVA